MSLDGGSLFITLFFSLVGCAFFVYGKKQTELWYMLTGLGLMVYPYFVSGVAVSLVIGVLLSAAPFVARRLDLF